MTDNIPSSLPPPPGTAGAPGYEGPPGANGHAHNSHMPPPPVPILSIPQNNNPIPTAITTPLSGDSLSPNSARGFVTRAAPEPNKRALYVGGLDPRVTEDVLKQIFETTGHVQSVKIVPEKNIQAKGLNYGFVEYDDPGAAERAMTTLNGRRVHQSEIKVNWAYQSNTNTKEDTSNHFHIFVGDLSNEVNDEVLLQAFSAFGSVSEARVMWDMKTGRSRGYGFVAFRERPEAEKALSSMDGEWLGSRAIRCNWANQKGQPSISQQQAMAAMGMTPPTPFGHHHFPTHGVQSYDMVVQQTPTWQTTCYVGNLTPYTTQNDLVPLFQNFGYVVETRMQSDRGFAFVKMDTHENAAMAICQLSGYNVNGRPLKCSWGKDRPPTGTPGSFDQYSPQTSLNSASTPGFNSATTPNFGSVPTPSFGSATTPGSGYQTSPYYPQYGGGPPGPITPQGPSPGGHHQAPYTNQQQNAYVHQQPMMPQQSYGQMPGSAGGYGRGPTTPGGMYQPPQQPLQSYPGNGYPSYQG